MTDDEEISKYGQGWAFYKLDGVRGGATVPLDADAQWLDGFCAALAEYPDREDCSIETALLMRGVPAAQVAALLEMAANDNGGEWKRWPSIPLRSGHVLVTDTLANASAKIFGNEMG